MQRAGRQPTSEPAPDAAALRAAAIAHLARYAATEAGLRRVLFRRIDRWARRVGEVGEEPGAVAVAVAAARGAATEVARAMVAAGAVDDAGFAAARARRLARAGRSRRGIAAHLAGKGIDRATAAAALPEATDEIDAALAYLRRRRMGPFAGTRAAAGDVKVLAALARAGFDRGTAHAALALDPDAAAARLIAARSM